ncbi:MAG: hypothetical protein U0V04_00880 [Spirosomataceae bacterium]
MIWQYGYKEYSSKILLPRDSHSVSDGDTVGAKKSIRLANFKILTIINKMKNRVIILLFLILNFGCNSQPKKKDKPINKEEVVHLKDTVKIRGKSILILLPDSLRFLSYVNSGQEWIYEVDSDFGFGFSKALDSLNIEGINEEITVKRYVEIIDCKGCPFTVDRDTINYGYILTKPSGEIEIDKNVFGAEYYIQSFENYFKKK